MAILSSCTADRGNAVFCDYQHNLSTLFSARFYRIDEVCPLLFSTVLSFWDEETPDLHV